MADLSGTVTGWTTTLEPGTPDVPRVPATLPASFASSVPSEPDAVTGYAGRQGAVTGGTATAGTVTGAENAQDAVTGTTTTAGSVTGSAARVGTVAGTTSSSGVVTGSPTLAGTVTGTTTTSGTVTGTGGDVEPTPGYGSSPYLTANPKFRRKPKPDPERRFGDVYGTTRTSGAVAGRKGSAGYATASTQTTGHVAGRLGYTGTTTGGQVVATAVTVTGVRRRAEWLIADDETLLALL